MIDVTDKRLEFIAINYGPRNQLEKTLEELREFVSAFSEYEWLSSAYFFDQPDTDVELKDHLIEETVDFSIMLSQIVFLYGGDPKKLFSVRGVGADLKLTCAHLYRLIKAHLLKPSVETKLDILETSYQVSSALLGMVYQRHVYDKNIVYWFDKKLDRQIARIGHGE